jgi:hypothetical protein
MVSENYIVFEGTEDSAFNEPGTIEPNLRYSKNKDFSAKRSSEKRTPEKPNIRKEVGRNHIYV